MTRKKLDASGFGARLAAIRKARGLTQIDVADAIDSTQRAMSYYESDTGYAPAPVIVQLAEVLNVTTDELLGVKAPKVVKEAPEDKTLLRKLEKLKQLPEKDQRAVIRLLNSLAKANESRQATKKKTTKKKRRSKRSAA